MATIEEELLEQTDTDAFDGDEMTLDDLQGKWIKNPKVGEEVLIKIKRVVKSKNITAKDRNGKVFSRALSKVDYAIELHDENGAIYTVGAWEVWGKLKAVLKKNGTIPGSIIKIKHLLDGMRPENKDKDCYDVLIERPDGKFYRLTRKTEQWQLESQPITE